MSDLEYPYCAKFEGKRKLECLIRAIMRDDSISKDMKKKRIVYLIALNKKHKWTKMETVRKMVDEALERLEKKKSKRKGGKKTAKKKKVNSIGKIISFTFSVFVNNLLRICHILDKKVHYDDKECCRYQCY